MKIKFSFFAYGILAVAALALVLSFFSEQLGKSGSIYYAIAVCIVVAFFLYMFMKLFRRGY